MADTKISALTSLAGSAVDPAADVVPIVDTSVTTTKKITMQAVFDSANTLTTLASASLSAGADFIPIYSAGDSATKKLLVANLSTGTAATQAEQETATSTAVNVTPGRQQYHPSAPKAWGLITPATTVTASYPAAGVSVVKNGTGDYTVTHGVTFSSTSYTHALSLTAPAVAMCVVAARTTTTVQIKIYDIAANPYDPTSFSYALFGDLA